MGNVFCEVDLLKIVLIIIIIITTFLKIKKGIKPLMQEYIKFK